MKARSPYHEHAHGAPPLRSRAAALARVCRKEGGRGCIQLPNEGRRRASGRAVEVAVDVGEESHSRYWRRERKLEEEELRRLELDAAGRSRARPRRRQELRLQLELADGSSCASSSTSPNCRRAFLTLPPSLARAIPSHPCRCCAKHAGRLLREGEEVPPEEDGGGDPREEERCCTAGA
jgi:hypothetical protein